MDKITEIINHIAPLPETTMNKVQHRLDNLTKPPGSLAALEEMARQLAGVWDTPRPEVPKKVIILMAADHGVAVEGVSAYPPEVTAQMVYNFVRGGAAINVLARHAGAELVLVDVGVNADFPANLPIHHAKVRAGTANIRYGPAMSRDEAIMALKVGIDTANDVINQGAQVIGLGEMGIANTTASSAVTAVLTGNKPSAVVGLGTGITQALLSHKVGIIETALAVNTPEPDDVIDVLAKVGGLEITALAGVALASAARHVPVMLDGFISSVAALAAYRLAPAIQPYLIASHLSAEPGHAVILETLKLKPRLLLDLRLGEGTGAALGMSLLDAGVKILNEMATFDEAQVAKAIDDNIDGEIL